MTGASLGYNGVYNTLSLINVGVYGDWWASTVFSVFNSNVLDLHTNTSIHPQNNSNKYSGRSVRYHATQSEPDALIIAIRLNQARIIHS
ncbi:hypothetical protein IKG12_01460 [Candidatus Saccharibacteria bacterium]|nr:hypothetical protein [Candidatus Saccharibacteria bacterium]